MTRERGKTFLKIEKDEACHLRLSYFQVLVVGVMDMH